MSFERIAEFVLAGQDVPHSALNMAATLLIDTVGEDARFPAGRWSDISVTLKDGTWLASGDVQARG